MLTRIARWPSRSSLASLITGAGALSLAFGVKAFYSRAGADELLWVLAPSAWLARFVGGVDLVYEQGAGFISHAHRLVVGPACAGVNFLVICFLCVYFSFARFTSRPRWFVYSLLIAFGGTVAANGLRIFVSAHLWDADIYRGWMTRELVHRLAGIAIYYASLVTLYCVVGSSVGTRAPRVAPLLWYVGISIGVPLAGRLVAGGPAGLAGHAAWVIGVALMITLATGFTGFAGLTGLPSALRNRIHCRT
jgi:exosortase K